MDTSNTTPVRQLSPDEIDAVAGGLLGAGLHPAAQEAAAYSFGHGGNGGMGGTGWFGGKGGAGGAGGSGLF